MSGDAGRYQEILGDTKVLGDIERCWEMLGDTERVQLMLGDQPRDAGRCQEMPGDAWRWQEISGDSGRFQGHRLITGSLWLRVSLKAPGHRDYVGWRPVTVAAVLLGGAGTS